MAFREKITLSGKLDIKLFDKNGKLKIHRQVPNTITSLGKEYIADRLGSRTLAAMSNMAIGTSTPSATALGVELNRRIFKTNTSTGATWTYSAEWNIDDEVSGTVTEAGVFNADSGLGGTMLCSSSFTGIVKALNDSLTITWTLTVS